MDSVNAVLEIEPESVLREEHRAFYVDYLLSNAFAEETNRAAGVVGRHPVDEPRIRWAIRQEITVRYGIPSSTRLEVHIAPEVLIPSFEPWVYRRAARLNEDLLFACTHVSGASTKIPLAELGHSR